MKELPRWAKLINERGHAGTFARKTPPEKRAVEWETAAEWVRSMEAEFGETVSRLVLSETDPPDLTADWNGKCVAVELVELVDAELLRDLDQARKQGRLREASAKAFTRSQWRQDRFVRAINGCLDKKQERYNSRKLLVDVVVIYSDEDWLRAAMVRQWLDIVRFEPRSALRNAYLMLTYDPTEAAHWPLFRLFCTPASADK